MARYFNKNIKYLRKQRRISQEELSVATGIERSILSRIENDKIETSIENAYKLSAFFDIPMDQLLGKDLVYEENVMLDESHILDSIIMNKSKELTEDDKQKLINIIDTVFDNENKM